MSDDNLGKKKDIRCFCSRKPLLAMYGVDEDSRLYVHIKIHKGDRIFGEFLIRGGEVRIKCRECLRWYKILIRENVPKLEESSSPPELENEQQSFMVFSDNVS